MNTDILTPQNVIISQPLASVGERIVARIIDYVIMFIYIIVFSGFMDAIATTIHEPPGEWWYLMGMLPVIFYSFIFETLWDGQTPGKRMFRLQVMEADCTQERTGSALMRWMFLLADVWMSFVGVIFLLATKRNQRIGDLAAGTIVIKRPKNEVAISLGDETQTKRNYQMTYPQAERLSMGQADLIRKALGEEDPERRQSLIDTLAQKVADFLRLRPEGDKEKFLSTVLSDYEHALNEK